MPSQPTGSWRSLFSIFQRGERRGLNAELRLSQAYQHVFMGDPSREDQELVLADLAKESGAYMFSLPATSSTEALWHTEGKRALFLHIMARLNVRDADLRELQYAARREAAVDQYEQEGTN